MEKFSLDSTVIRSHQKATGEKSAEFLFENQSIGLSRGGQVHDSRIACQLLKSIDISQLNVIADKAYGTAEIRHYIEAKAGYYTIPPKEDFQNKWACDYHIYCERHLIENLFNQLKNYRKIATRYDKFTRVFLTTVYIASICILLK